MDQTQETVMFAILSEIDKAIDANTSTSDESDHLIEIRQLVHAARCVMVGNPVRDR